MQCAGCGILFCNPHLLFKKQPNIIIRMAYNHRKRKEDIGLSPYEIKIRGHRKASTAQVKAINFSIEGASEIDINSIGELKSFTNDSQFSWINIIGLCDEELINNISVEYNIPANIMSDVLDPSLRPQVEDFDDGLFISLKMLQADEVSQTITRETVCLIIKDKVIFSFVDKSDNIFVPIKNRIKRKKSRIHTSGTDYLAFTILDIIIDNYIYILDTYGDKVEKVEEDITLTINRDTLKVINLLKQELNHFRRDMRPVKEIIFSLPKLDTNLIADENETHFKELQDNISQVSELLDYFREVLYDALDVYHSSMSTKLNDIMAVLTVFSVVFIPLTFIAGLYGMNFSNMPELESPYGYYIVLVVMIVIAIAMLLYFKRKKWF